MTTRREFLRSAAALSAALPWAGRASGAARPDILFIAIEDASPHRFGCYGGPCQTPHLDAFAQTGVRFTDCHTNPPCCPSRTALFLCQRPDTTKVFGNNDDWRKLVPGALTMPAHLRAHGYETIRCGKMFHGSGAGAWEDEQTWDRVLNPNDGFTPPPKARAAVGPGAGLGTGDDGGSPFIYGPTGRDDLHELDGRHAEQAIRTLRARQPGDKPLLLAIGQHATHLPFRAPDKYHDLYPVDQMKLPANPDAGPDGMPADGRRLPPYNPHTPEQFRAAIAAHFACISFVDAQIGRILAALDEAGRADQTIVVIWTDHGFMLGEQWNWRKGPLRDLSTGDLLLWRAPGVSQAGGVCRRPVESIDIFPTIFELCDVPAPNRIEAASFRRLLADPAASWKQAALMNAGRSHGLVTEDYRYGSYPNGRRELFDRHADPGEFRNLAEDPARAATVTERQALLEGGWRACLPG